MIKVIVLMVSSIILAQGMALATESSKQVYLARNSNAQFSIVAPVESSPQELNAANELKYYLDRITDGDFHVVKESSNNRIGKSIYVGMTHKLAASFPDFKIDSLGKDGIFLKTSKSGDIFISGKGPRGTLYAAYSFLEDFCGVRWWTPDAETIPTNSCLKISTPNLTYSPKMEYRDSWFLEFNNWGDRAKIDNDARIRFCVRMKNNGFFNRIPPTWGGNTICLPAAWPVFFQLIPPEKYLNEHPEWFSEIDGKRTSDQLCLSNKEMRKEMALNLLEMIKKTPGVDMVTITQNDSGKDNFCHCSTCKAIDAKEGSPAGLLLQCVNSVAEIVEKEYPELNINTLAYQYNLKPPLITKPRANVSIQICCPYDSDRFDSPYSKLFFSELRAWSGMSQKMYAWTYQTDFGDVLNPVPSYFNLGPNIRTLAKYNVKGIFAQGNSFAPIGDFPELKAWLIAKLLWNPSLNDKALINEFMDAYYGKSAKPLHKYLELAANEYSKLSPDAKRNAFNHNAYATPPKLTPWMGLNAMNQATNFFNDAERLAASNPKYLERVRRARQSIDFQWIIGWKMYKHIAEKEGKQFLGPKDQLEAFNTFIDNCHKRNVLMLCEGNGSLDVLHDAIFQK